MNSLFPSFLRSQSRFFRTNWLVVGASVTFSLLFAFGLYSYEAQTQIIDAIASQALSDAAIEAKTAALETFTRVSLMSILAVFISFAIIGTWADTRVKSRYQALLTTLDFQELKRLAQGLETDQQSRQFLIQELTRRQPGWSYA